MALEKIETDSVREVIKSLPIHSKLTQLAVLMQHDQGLNRITTGSVYESYAQLCRTGGISSLTKRRVSDFISELSTLGIIDTSLISTGAYGRTRVIRLVSCPSTIKDAFMEDEEIKDFIFTEAEMKVPRIQTRLI